MFCEFGNNLETYLRDQLVWGVASENIKKKLLSEKDLTYQKAIEIAVASEAASRDAAKMLSPSTSTLSSEAVNFISKQKKEAKTRDSTGGGSSKNCFCCGRVGHIASACRFRTYTCNNCERVGHLQKVCRSAAKESNSKNPTVDQNKNKDKTDRCNFVEESEELSERLDSIFVIRDPSMTVKYLDEPVFITLYIEKAPLKFEVDTGSSITAISTRLYDQLEMIKSLPCNKTSRSFRSYTGEKIVPHGVVNVRVDFQGKSDTLELFVLPSEGMTPIVGRRWLRVLNALDAPFEKSLVTDVSKVNSVTENLSRDIVLKEFPTVFTTKLGNYNKDKFSLELKPNAVPVFVKPRPVPYALRDKLGRELTRLENAGIIEPVKSSDWATPIVPVLKTSGEIRVCGDYEITVNRQLKIDRHPIPRIADLLVQLEKGLVFSKLDLAQAYQQVELDDESKCLTTISTHKGLFQFNRLSYGIASAPGLFQREMEKLLGDMTGVVVYFDDIVVSGIDRETHDKRLREVLCRFREAGLTVKIDKCEIAAKSIQFLGYQLDKRGLHISDKKIEAIVKMKEPETLHDLQAFLGAMNYFAKFIKNYAKVVAPLYELLRKGERWHWSKERREAFKEAKDRLISHDVLCHYDSETPIKVTCDASPFGLGAVLFHVFPGGEQRPVAYASRALTRAERNYSQLDREALGLVFGVKEFHQYIYGRHFILETDHKPLTYIFGSKKGLPQMAASRVQRWAVFLAGYDFEINYLQGKDNGPADALSRVIEHARADQAQNERETYSYLNFICDDVKTIDRNEIREATARDPILTKVRDYLLKGWPVQVEEGLQSFKSKELELTLESGCILWGHRLVIPSICRERILSELHSAHMGVVKMKTLARSYVWWPRIDHDIENLAKSCDACLKDGPNPPKAELHVWQWPEGPNERIHVDFCGPINGHMYLVITDAYSKWLDVRELPNITTPTTIGVLREYFDTWGLPCVLVSDNGPTFTSEDFSIFLKENCVQHVRTAPYHPASNGAAENAVRTFKDKFKLLCQNMTRQVALTKYLFAYRTTPHCTTNCTPAELQMGRKLRTRLSALHAHTRFRVKLNQNKQKLYFKGNRRAEFGENDLVIAKDYSTNSWRKAQVIEKVGAVNYNVRTDDNRIWKRHVDQLQAREINAYANKPDCVPTRELVSEAATPNYAGQGIVGESHEEIADNHIDVNTKLNRSFVTSEAYSPSINVNREPLSDALTDQPAELPVVTVRRSNRIRKAPDRLDL